MNLAQDFHSIVPCVAQRMQQVFMAATTAINELTNKLQPLVSVLPLQVARPATSEGEIIAGFPDLGLLFTTVSSKQ